MQSGQSSPGDAQYIKVEGVRLIPGALFEVDAIGTDLDNSLFSKNLPSLLPPSSRSGQLGPRGAGAQHRQRFTGQVRVRAEPGREVSLDVIDLQRNRTYEVSTKRC